MYFHLYTICEKITYCTQNHDRISRITFYRGLRRSRFTQNRFVPQSLRRRWQQLLFIFTEVVWNGFQLLRSICMCDSSFAIKPSAAILGHGMRCFFKKRICLKKSVQVKCRQFYLWWRSKNCQPESRYLDIYNRKSLKIKNRIFPQKCICSEYLTRYLISLLGNLPDLGSSKIP